MEGTPEDLYKSVETRHEQRRLEQLGINFDDTFDLRKTPELNK